MKYTLGFIGCGNMGGALLRAATKCIDAEKIAICDQDVQKMEGLEKELGVTISSATELAQEARFVILGVKPQTMELALSPIASILCEREDVILVTMAAALSISTLRGYIKKDVPVIRIMPNTPVTLGAGMCLFTHDGVDEETEREFLQAFSCAGVFDKVTEKELDAGGALSGCGPAFLYAFAKALAEGAVECGITEEKAELYAAQTLLGAAKMLLEFGNPSTLIDNVCSPGGTTLAGMAALQKGDFDSVVKNAITAAYQRTLELKK